MICKKCGAQIEDTSTVCKFCGATYETPEPITEQPVEAVPITEEVPGINNDAATETLFDENEIKRQRQMEKMRAEKQSQLDEIEKRRKEKKIKQKRTKLLVVLIALLCLGGAAFGGYYIFNNDSDTGSDNTEIIIESSTETVTDVPTVAPEASEMPSETPSEMPSEIPTTTPVATNAPSDASSNGGSAGGSGTGTKPAATSKPKPVVTQKPAAKPNPAATPKPTAKPKPATTQKPSSGSAVKPSTSTATMGGTQYYADGGMTSDGNFSAALVTGVEVVKNSDKTYMSFKYNGAVYYAKVSANTTTNFITGKAMTLSAYKISEMYNGVNVYEITAITHYNGSYVFPNSGFKLLTEADLAGKSDWELRVGRNEIYARHGRKFKDGSLQTYFNSCSWYRVKSSFNYSNDSSNLNAIERANAAFIKKYEDTH